MNKKVVNLKDKRKTKGQTTLGTKKTSKIAGKYMDKKSCGCKH